MRDVLDEAILAAIVIAAWVSGHLAVHWAVLVGCTAAYVVGIVAWRLALHWRTRARDAEAEAAAAPSDDHVIVLRCGYCGHAGVWDASTDARGFGHG